MVNLMITIAITAFKEEKIIGKCLNSILSQKLPKEYEILISCPDKPTINVVKEYMKKNKKIKLIGDPGRGKPAALNLIFKRAKGEIIVCTCGDIIMGKNSLELLLRHFQDPKVGAVGSNPTLIRQNSFLDDWYEMNKRARHMRRMYEKKRGDVVYVPGQLFAVRKDIVKNFEIPENACLDDGVISYETRLRGFRIEYEPEAKAYTKCPTTLKDFINQATRICIGQYQMRRWYRIRNVSRKKIHSFSVQSKFGLKKMFVFLILWFIYLSSYIYGLYLLKSGAGISKMWMEIKTTKR